ncbi:serine/threonine protein kinase [Niallia endozanthoxylica]|uniref:Serine/threonine protein kinase n=1 Tax=Niallia endozanthoxylica TaxID=2036016 RepID=A0A5J5I4X7_9BACI|nr:serine/threonine protein kinase [Niallia endozanthoxylica]KAA9030653.1 serine/threonine protein kinase [Niallia endozanthoxylica]
MREDWMVADIFLSNISISSNPNNEPVSIHGSSDHLRCIGIGTDAAVFQSIDVPAYAFKMYANDKMEKIQIEKKVYELLGDSPYFSTCFGFKDNYLVLNFEEGINLYDCLVQGIPIPKQVIKDIDDAREYARQKGLNPRDIHLKNVLLQNGRAKIIDVSEYVQPGNDFRWEHLKKGYDRYYHLIEGKPIPLKIIETIRKRYNQRSNYSAAFEEFIGNNYKFLTALRK